MKHVMLDIETLGTNINSQVLSIGACEFNREGEISNTFYNVVKLDDEVHVKTTPGTLKFWSTQEDELSKLLESPGTRPMTDILTLLSKRFDWDNTRLWANGTKFDIAGVEYLYKENNMQVPWRHNADMCLRTLRHFAGNIDIPFIGRPHHALDDAVWQAKYVAQACKQLGLEL